jgi:uncharacterized protein YggE
MKMKNCVVIFLMFLSIKSFAQRSEVETQKPHIEVVGTAELEIIPNEIFIAIILKERMVNKEKISIESQEEQLKTSLKNSGFDLKNLTLTDAGAALARLRGKQKDLLTGKSYSLKVASVEELNKAFTIFDQLDIENADVNRVSHTEIDKYRKEVRIKAIQAAKAKAQYLLEAIGEKLGKPLLINELQTYDIDRNRNELMLNVRSVVDYKSDDLIGFKAIKLTSSINVKFEILP